MMTKQLVLCFILIFRLACAVAKQDDELPVVVFDPVNRSRNNMLQVLHPVTSEHSQGIRGRTNKQEQTKSESALVTVDDPPMIGIRDRTIKQERSMSENAPLSAVADPQIIGGTTARDGEYPFFSSIIPSSNFLCGASLVAPDVLITAAHCYNAFEEGAIVGATRLGQVTDGSEEVEVVKRVVHPDADIMLIKISPAVTAIDYVQIDLNPALPAAGVPLDIIGFGLTTENGEVSPTLQKAQVEEVRIKKCGNKFDATLDPTELICVWNKEPFRNACDGDSGGPLLSTVNNTLLTFGVLSFGRADCRDGPSVYVRLSGYDSYLRSKICSLSSSPPDYLECDDN